MKKIEITSTKKLKQTFSKKNRRTIHTHKHEHKHELQDCCKELISEEEEEKVHIGPLLYFEATSKRMDILTSSRQNDQVL